MVSGTGGGVGNFLINHGEQGTMNTAARAYMRVQKFCYFAMRVLLSRVTDRRMAAQRPV